MDRYLIGYLKAASQNSLQTKYIDYFKVELDWFIYNYGDHVANVLQLNKQLSWKIFVGLHLPNLNVSYGKVKQYSNMKNVLSSLHFLDKNILLRLGFNPISSIFQPVGNTQIIKDTESFKMICYKLNALAKGKFKDIYNQDFFEKLELLKNKTVKKYEKYNFGALLLYTDQFFESKFLIEIFKILDRPSIVFSHGLPGIYSMEVDNRADYLMVWGDKIKQNYVNTGFNPDKLFVVGNPKYQKINKVSALRNTLEDILVLPIGSFRWHQDTYGEPELYDRSMVILYLYKVQRVLERLGVRQARFRPHPSIDKEWVYGFLDQGFYKIDKNDLKESCLKSTLIIGVTSTVFLEALMYGVNYIVFEPKSSDNKNIMRCDLVPPFDGSEPNLEIATSEAELEYLIKNKYQVDINILDGYMKPLDLTVLKEIIK